MKVWNYRWKQWKEQHHLWESLGFGPGLFPCPENRRLELLSGAAAKHLAVSLVGGGGKTSVMYQLAFEAAKMGKKVIVTTSTNLAWPHFPNEEFPDQKDTFPVFIKGETPRAEFFRQVEQALESHPIVMAGEKELWKETKEGERIHKIKGLSTEALDQLKERCDLLLIEADGARRLPFKLPADHEPVITPHTDLVIGCMGLSCIGRPWSEKCFRWELAAEHFQEAGLESQAITPEMAAAVLGTRWGTKKSVGDRPFFVTLNQADDRERREAAREIAGLLDEQEIPIVMTCFHHAR